MGISGKVYNLVMKPRFRYSKKFIGFQNILRYNDMEKIIYFSMEMAKRHKERGDYFEFGVWKGGTFIPAYHMAKNRGLNMHFYAFDSFEGLPRPKGVDDDGSYKKGDFCYGLSEFKNILKRSGVNLSDVTTIKGFYRDTLNEATKNNISSKKASVILIDSDLYESGKQALDFVLHYLMEGSIIIFDNWYAFNANPDKGEQRAFREWTRENSNLKISEFVKSGTKISFIIQKIK